MGFCRSRNDWNDAAASIVSAAKPNRRSVSCISVSAASWCWSWSCGCSASS